MATPRRPAAKRRPKPNRPSTLLERLLHPGCIQPGCFFARWIIRPSSRSRSTRAANWTSVRIRIPCWRQYSTTVGCLRCRSSVQRTSADPARAVRITASSSGSEVTIAGTASAIGKFARMPAASTFTRYALIPESSRRCIARTRSYRSTRSSSESRNGESTRTCGGVDSRSNSLRAGPSAGLAARARMFVSSTTRISVPATGSAPWPRQSRLPPLPA